MAEKIDNLGGRRDDAGGQPEVELPPGDTGDGG